MPLKCVVPNCKSGYTTCKEKYSIFKIPEEQVDIWNKSICRADRLLTSKDHVCERHFSDDCIIREWISGDGLTKVPYKIPRLRNGAYPTIFPDRPKNLLKRKLPASKTIKESMVIKKEIKTYDSDENDDTTQKITKIDIVQNSSFDTFECLWNYIELVKLPSSSWGFHKMTLAGSRYVVFVNLKIPSKTFQVPVIERQVIIDDKLIVQFCNGSSKISSNSWTCNIQTITTVDHIIEIIAKFSALIFCSGGPNVSFYPETKIKTSVAKIDCITNRWRHKNCQQICFSSSSCKKCAPLSQNFDMQLKHKKKSTRLS